MTNRKRILIVGASNAALMAAEALRKAGEQFDAIVEHEGHRGGLEFKTALEDVSASYKPRRNKSDRKRNKRQRWK